MTEIPANNWPKPYLLGLYEKAVDEGCVRVLLDGDETKFKSLKASWLRLRRRRDIQSFALMRPEYYLCSIVWEPASGTALILYNQLPDNQELPEVQSVAAKGPKMQLLDRNAAPPPGPTPVDDPGDFDADAMVAGLLENITFDEEGNDEQPTTNIG